MAASPSYRDAEHLDQLRASILWIAPVSWIRLFDSSYLAFWRAISVVAARTHTETSGSPVRSPARKLRL
jgi:hypothetical protein